MRSRSIRTCLSFCLVGSGLIGCAAGAPLRTYSSVASGYSVTVGYQGNKATARFLYPGHQRPVFTALPVPGVVRVTWIDAGMARITVPVGTGVSATWFESMKSKIGPLPGVVVVDGRRKLVAYSDGHAIHIARLGSNLIAMSAVPVPSWCAFMACRYTAGFKGDTFELRSQDHRLTTAVEATAAEHKD